MLFPLLSNCFFEIFIRVSYRRGIWFPPWWDFKKWMVLLLCPQWRFSGLVCPALLVLWSESMRNVVSLEGTNPQHTSAKGVWEFLIHLVRTEHVTCCKSSGRVRDNVATQKEHRGGCVTPGPVCFHSQCLLFGLGRDNHLIYCLWRLKEVPNRTWQV